MYSIYALIDPTTQAARYIGITSDIKKRLYNHLREHRVNDAKWLWVQSLVKLGLHPLVKQLETVDSREQASIREQAWIEHYLASGYDLLNSDLVHGKRVPKSHKPIGSHHKHIRPHGTYITIDQAREMLGVSKAKMAAILKAGTLATKQSELDKRSKLVKLTDVTQLQQTEGR